MHVTTPSGSSRFRSALALLLVATLVASAGCTGALNDSGGGASAKPALGVVPANVDLIAYADVQGALNDETLRTLANDYLSAYSQSNEFYNGPSSIEDAISRANKQTQLDVKGLKSVTLFGRYGENAGAGDLPTSNQYSGAVFTATWSEDALVTAINNQSAQDLQKETYAGYTIYQSGSGDSYLGVIKDGKYVIGPEKVVKDTLDVAAGNAQAASGELVSAFENTRSGYVRFASTVQRGQVPTDQLSRAVNNANIFTSVQIVAGAQYVSGDTVGVTFSMIVDEKSTAENLKEVTEGGISYVQQTVSRADRYSKFASLVDDESISVSQSGTSVTITSKNAASELSDLIETLIGSRST